MININIKINNSLIILIKNILNKYNYLLINKCLKQTKYNK